MKRTLHVLGVLTWFVASATVGARPAGSCSLNSYRAEEATLTEASLDAPVATMPVLHEAEGVEDSGGCGDQANTCGGGGRYTYFDVEAAGLDRLAVRVGEAVTLYEPAARHPDGTFRFTFYEWDLPPGPQIEIALVTADDQRGAWAAVTLPSALFE